MLLNSIIAGIVGFIILILWILKGIYDVIGTMDKTIRKLAKVTDLLNNKLLRMEEYIRKKDKNSDS